MIKKITCKSVVSNRDSRGVWRRKNITETSYELRCVDCGDQLSIMSNYKANAVQKIKDMGWRTHEDMGDMCPDCLDKNHELDLPEDPEVSE